MKKVLSSFIAVALILQLFAMVVTVLAEENALITVSNESGTVGSIVTVKVGIVNNPGFHALQCEIEYDKSLMQLVSVSAGEKLIDNADQVDQFVASVGEGNVPAKFLYMGILPSGIPSELITGDVTVAILTFKLLEAGTSEVTVNCVESLYLNDAYEMIQFGTRTGVGTVSVSAKIGSVYGDVNGDGEVNVIDLGMLRKYLASIDPLTGLPSIDPSTGLMKVDIKPGADANADGEVNVIDLGMLRKYLASIDPVTNLPSFNLGPR